MAPWGKIENMLSTIQTLLRNASCFELLRLLINFNVNAVRMLLLLYFMCMVLIKTNLNFC